ncbi:MULTISPECIES: CPBP family glutamic-type intramembrane protease [Bacillus]|uniref:CPBP family glutamic-type intramembrane protease n=1 Tax=Bacillus TaxID=1386 RepID=UPI0033912136
MIIIVAFRYSYPFFFTVSIFSVCLITTWLRMKSGSLWTGVMIHAAHNCFLQLLFDP